MNVSVAPSKPVSVQGAENISVAASGRIIKAADLGNGKIRYPSEWTDLIDWEWPEGETGLLTSLGTVQEDIDCALPYVEKKTIAIQAGGACGMYPKYLAQHFEYVYTFEPNPTLFRCLCANCPEDNIFKLNAALASRDYDGAHLVCGAEKYKANLGAWYVDKGGAIPCLEIDDIGLKRVDLIYLDIEGGEEQALAGATETIKEYRPVIVVEDKIQTRRGREPWVTNWCDRMNYRIAETIKRDLVLVHE